jgi:hypothetical protein
VNYLCLRKDDRRRAEDTAETLDAASPAVGAPRATHAVGRWAQVGIALAAPLLWLGLAAEARADESTDLSAETTALVDSTTVSSDELESGTTDPVVSDPAPAPVPDPVVSDPAPAPVPDPVVSDPAPAPAPVVDPAPPAPGDAPGDSIVVIDGPAASLGPSYVPVLEYAFDSLSGGLSMPALAANRGSGSAAPAANPGDGQVSSERPGRSPLPAPRPDSTPAPAPSGGAAGSSNGFSVGVFAALTALLALASQWLGGALRLTVTPLRPPLLLSHLKRPG